MELKHIPVMVEEVMTFLRCEAWSDLCGCYPGRGRARFRNFETDAPDGVVIGMEWDEDALAEARNVLMPFGDRVKIFRENFIHLPDS